MVIESVEKEPTVDVVNWSVHRVTFFNGDKSEHLLGFVPDKQGRVTSAIQSFNADTRKITTASGRVYTLVGPPGECEDAAYVWQYWKNMNGDVKDRNVTDKYATQIKNLLM
ncbi:MAG: hypothetical protein L3J59_07170 [Methylococcaceae bacterium]|nr:hypothetical protein [Methylococcaceae bacterium]